MVILGIETSCDETALSLIEASGTLGKGIEIAVLADKTLSQIEIHREYGGVFPNLAKREHNRNLIPILKTVLIESGFGNPKSQTPNPKQIQNSKLEKILNREPELLTQFLEFIPTIKKPPIDAIAVTVGPGLEPCLWTGVNFAHALALVWDIPVVPVNHMEGHIFSALLHRKNENNEVRILNTARKLSSVIIHNSEFVIHPPKFPALALLISGGHTELVLVRGWFDYQIIGRTRDDAVGEAFDKVARLLGLPYPGGPEISRLAEQVRQTKQGLALDTRLSLVKLPRPMLHSNDFDFSFSGLKTAVLYLLKRVGRPDEKFDSSVGVSQRIVSVSPRLQSLIAREFEDAVTEVLVAKTKKAIQQCNNKTILIGGGVIANGHIRKEFEKLSREMGIPIFIPEPHLTTDNALMIAVAGFLRFSLKNGLTTRARKKELTPNGNLRLDGR